MRNILMLNTLPINNFGDTNKIKKTAGNQTLYNTLKGYSENGYNVTVLTFCDIPSISHPFPGITIKRSIFFRFFNTLLKFKQLFFKKKNKNINQVTTDVSVKGSNFLFTYWKFFGYIEGLFLAKKNNVNLIYGYEIYSTSPAKLIAKTIDVPSVSRFQGTELSFYLDDPAKFEAAKPYIKGTKVKTDLIIMANDGTRGDEILDSLGIEKKIVQFWVNGLNDKEKYINFKKDTNYKKKMMLPEDSIVICTANRFVDWKRVDRIIKVIYELTLKNTNIYLIAVGDGPEKEALNQLIKTLKIDKNVIFTGALEHAETIYHIANADLYITLNEGGNLGNSVLEAMALGTAVCTLRNKSVERVLSHGLNGVLLDTVDEKIIANEIIKLINDGKMLNYLKTNARDYAKVNLLSWPERMKLEVEKITGLIEEKM